MSAVEDYYGKVQATLWDAAGWVSPERRAWAQHLLDHGEPAEGMRELAFAIVEEATLVPRSLIVAIRELSEELVPAEDMPADLDRFGVDDEPDADGGHDGGHLV